MVIHSAAIASIRVKWRRVGAIASMLSLGRTCAAAQTFLKRAATIVATVEGYLLPGMRGNSLPVTNSHICCFSSRESR